MKKCIVFIVVLLMSFSYVSAGDEGTRSDEYRAVQSWDFDLEIESEGGKIELEWESFPEDRGFMWYKFAYSKTNSNPVYPDDTNNFLGDDVDMDEAEIWLKQGSYYVRLCAITQDENSRGRYCSDVQKVEVGGYEKEEYKKDYEKKKEIVKQKTIIKKEQVKKTYLSKNLRTRIDTLLKKFITRLESNGSTDEQKVEAIDTVIKRLQEHKSNPRYGTIIAYMEKVLMEYRVEYDTGLGELEEIFLDF